MRILHIEDDAATAQAVFLMLRAEGMVVEKADLGEDGIDLACHYAFDVIVLDGHLPDMGGLDALRAIRRAGVKTPVLMLTGDDSNAVKTEALNAGADGYLVKPFHKDVLVATIRSLVRRSVGQVENVVTVGNLTVQMDAQRALVDGKPVALTGKEWGVVELLARRCGATINKQVFLDHLYGGLDEPEAKIIDVFVCKIRGKLKRAGADEVIQTTWGRGYVMRAPDQAAA